MLSFWRLDTIDNDFALVQSPAWARAAEIRAYHVELLSRVRCFSDYHFIESDAIFFNAFACYYEKISSRLIPTIPANLLSPQSRHKFFIAAEARGEHWISGLELLMGYDFSSCEVTIPQLRVTSGNSEIDLLAELLLITENSNVSQWLIQERSPQYLCSLVKQISDRRRGKEALDDLQRQKDLEACETSMDEMCAAGFIIPEV